MSDPQPSGIDPADVDAIRAQLERRPRGIDSIGHRCPCGNPDVVATEPRLPNGTPFPTTYYLTCPRAASRIGTLEGNHVMKEMQDRLATDRITLKVDIDPGIGTFTGDERRVVQVLYNLLANAVGFSPHDAVVTVSARRTDTHVVFKVADTGTGIPPEAKDKVFDWFESYSNGSRHRGAGLGLSLVRSFVELHGGKVRVDSVVGKGTTVTCDFPIEQAAHRNAAE